MIRGAVLAITPLHVLDEIVGDAGAGDAGNVHRIPVILQTIVRVVEKPRVTGGVARQHRRGIVARHRTRRGLEHRIRHTRRLVRNQQHVFAVDTRQRLRLLGARRPDRNKRALGVAFQLDAIGLDLEQVVERGLEPLGHVLHLREARVEELGRRGRRDHRLARHAHQNVPDGSHGNGSRLTDAVSGAHRDASNRGGGDGVQQLHLPLVRRDADDLFRKRDGVVSVAAHQRDKRVVGVR